MNKSYSTEGTNKHYKVLQDIGSHCESHEYVIWIKSTIGQKAEQATSWKEVTIQSEGSRVVRERGTGGRREDIWLEEFCFSVGGSCLRKGSRCFLCLSKLSSFHTSIWTLNLHCKIQNWDLVKTIFASCKAPASVEAQSAAEAAALLQT